MSTLTITGMPPGQVVTANAWRFSGEHVIRQEAEIYIAPVFWEEPRPKCVAFDFHFAPKSCVEYLDEEEPRSLEFWVHADVTDWNTKPWIRFGYPYVTRVTHGILRAHMGPPVEMFREEVGDGFPLSLGGFTYVDGPLPPGKRRKRAPSLPEIAR